ncbi:MAG: hypothetical protein ACK41W_00260 [Cyanobacteriota bacterium]|jgi:hypothetical protein
MAYYRIYTPAEMAVLRRSAAQWRGSFLPKSISARLRLAFSQLQVLRNAHGHVAGFGSEGFVLTPSGWGLYSWNENRERQAHINRG